MSESVVPEAARRAIGVAKRRRVEVTARDIKRFAQAIGETNPVHFDEEYACRTRHGGIVAPPLFCQSLTYEDVPPDHLAPDGSPVELAAPVPATRTVGGSSEYTIHRLVRPGDVIEITTVLRDVTAKQGRSGLLYLISVETTFTDVDQSPVAGELATYIKRAER
jgi:acyl dehydratase